MIKIKFGLFEEEKEVTLERGDNVEAKLAEYREKAGEPHLGAMIPEQWCAEELIKWYLGDEEIGGINADIPDDNLNEIEELIKERHEWMEGKLNYGDNSVDALMGWTTGGVHSGHSMMLIKNEFTANFKGGSKIFAREILETIYPLSRTIVVYNTLYAGDRVK